MNTSQTQPSNEPETTAPTTEQACDKAHDVIDKARPKAEELERKVRLEAARLSEKYQEGKGEAKQQIDETLEKVDAFVKERPVQAAGIAFAAGILATLLLRR